MSMSENQKRDLISFGVLAKNILGLRSLSPALIWRCGQEIEKAVAIVIEHNTSGIALEVVLIRLGETIVNTLCGTDRTSVAYNYILTDKPKRGFLNGHVMVNDVPTFLGALAILAVKMIRGENMEVSECLALYQAMDENYTRSGVEQIISNHWPEVDIVSDAIHRRGAIQYRVIATLLLGYVSHRELLDIGEVSEKFTHRIPNEDRISRAYLIAKEICSAETIRNEMGNSCESALNIRNLWIGWLSAFTGKAFVAPPMDLLVLSSMAQKMSLRAYDPRASMDEVFQKIFDQSTTDIKDEILPIDWRLAITAVKAIYPLTAPQS